MEAGDTPRARPSFPERLARAQLRRPWLFIAAGVALAALALPIILGVGGLSDGLTLNSEFTALLPEHSQSVRDLNEIQERFGGQQAMTLAIEARDVEALHRFTRDLATRVEALDEHKVVAVDWNVSDFARFVEQNRHLYAELSDLEAVRDALRERLDYERARANPFFLDLDDEQPPPDPEAAVRRVERNVRRAQQDAERRFPEGFLQHPSRGVVLMVVHTRIPGGDAAQTDRLFAAIRAEIDALRPASYAPDLRVYWGGTLVEVREETESLMGAVRDATILTLSLVMISIFVLFLRVRPIPLLSLSLMPPVLVTFAIAELTVDYLNASSAFLSSIVVGNGINPMLIWLARYFETRRSGEDGTQALITCHRGTWKGTLTASLAAGLAYGSLMSTDYRGFRDFGVVGGTGMVLCWLGTYLFLPALVVAFDRIRPLKFARESTNKGVYGAIFSRLALGSPRLVVGVAVALTIVTGGIVGWGLANDPMEYDFRRLRSERDVSSDPEQVLRFSQAILTETLAGSALAVLAQSPEQVDLFKAQLDERRASTPRAYGDVRRIDDLLPAGQSEKLAVLRELRQLMLDARPHLDADLQRVIDEQLPPEDLRSLGPNDLPRSVARPYTERDGTRGRLLFIEHHHDESPWDGRYMGRWADAARSLRAPGADRPPPVAGTAVVFADLNETVWRDGPRAVGIAFLSTILLLIMAFREHKQRWITLVSLLVGILWMAGAMAFMGMRLNFLNFIAFPIAFGNGVDYAVNVMRRYADEIEAGRGKVQAVREAVEGTGGAVVLCSLTTVFGYTSIHTSTNQALTSFGAAAGIAEITCLGAAVVVLPAVLYLLARREEGKAAPSRSAQDAQAS
jgi:hypothetical protein